MYLFSPPLLPPSLLAGLFPYHEFLQAPTKNASGFGQKATIALGTQQKRPMCTYISIAALFPVIKMKFSRTAVDKQNQDRKFRQ